MEQNWHQFVSEICKHFHHPTTAVNASRWALFEKLKTTGLPVEVGSGGRYSNSIAQCWAFPKNTG
jgi:hypothetical protein